MVPCCRGVLLVAVLLFGAAAISAGTPIVCTRGLKHTEMEYVTQEAAISAVGGMGGAAARLLGDAAASPSAAASSVARPPRSLHRMLLQVEDSDGEHGGQLKNTLPQATYSSSSPDSSSNGSGGSFGEGLRDLLNRILQLPLFGGSGSGANAGPASSPALWVPAGPAAPAVAAPPPAAPTWPGPAQRPKRPASTAAVVRADTPTVDVDVKISFTTTGAFSFALRLPPWPRTMAVYALSDVDGSVAASATSVPYEDGHTVRLRVPAGMTYAIQVFDEEDEALLLFSSSPGAVDATAAGSMQEVQAMIALQPVELLARFTRIAWSGSRPVAGGTAADANISVIGAKLTLWTRGGAGSMNSSEGDGIKWASRYTDEEGLALFFIPPASEEFWVNFTLGSQVLASRRADPVPWQGGLPGAAYLTPPVVNVDADTRLLCTGDLEEIRAARGARGGTFPPEGGNGAYAPLNFACRWAIIPPAQGATVTMEVDYSMMLPGESLLIYLDATTTIVLTPGCCNGNGRYATSVVVDGSIPIEFRTSDSPDRKVGGFRITWEATRGGEVSGSAFTPQELLTIVISVAASALLALGVCAFCVRRRRRRRAIRAAAAAAGAAAPRHCPSAVRRLLPSKPYVPPEHNPLPGANPMAAGGAAGGPGGNNTEAERDCCSICLVEFDPGEAVTVLPCRHFYHAECIDGWLKRNTTCCLCKADVLAAMEALAASRCTTPSTSAPAASAAAAPADPSPRGPPPASWRQRGLRRVAPAGSGSRRASRRRDAAVAAAAAAAVAQAQGPVRPAPLEVPGAAGAEEGEDAFVTVSVILTPRSAAAAAAAAAEGAAAGAGATSPSNVASPTGGARAQPRTPSVAPAGRADASAEDFLAAAAAAAAIAARRSSASAAGSPTPLSPTPAAGAPRAPGADGVEMQPVRAAQALSQRVLGLLGLAAADGQGGESSTSQQQQAAAQNAATAFPPRTVSIYAWAGPGASGGGAESEGGAQGPAAGPSPASQPRPA